MEAFRPCDVPSLIVVYKHSNHSGQTKLLLDKASRNHNNYILNLVTQLRRCNKMKSFTSIILLVAFSTIAISGAMPRDITPASTSTIESSLANASPPPASLAHPLSLLYPRAKENQDVHTRVVSSSYQKCTKAFIDCTKVCSFMTTKLRVEEITNSYRYILDLPRLLVPAYLPQRSC
jgi:hypothetical protein